MGIGRSFGIQSNGQWHWLHTMFGGISRWEDVDFILLMPSPSEICPFLKSSGFTPRLVTKRLMKRIDLSNGFLVHTSGANWAIRSNFDFEAARLT